MSKKIDITLSASQRLDAQLQQLITAVTNTELITLGQWVFEGRDAIWSYAAVDKTGNAYLYSSPPYRWCSGGVRWQVDSPGTYSKLDGKFDATDWWCSSIEREPVNDMEAYDDTRQDFEGQVLEDSFEVVFDSTAVTTQDLQRVFVQNLCDTLLQRMRSLNRFSNNKSEINGIAIQGWGATVSFNVVAARISDTPFYDMAHKDRCQYYSDNVRTITESEIDDWRMAMEAKYANPQ